MWLLRFLVTTLLLVTFVSTGSKGASLLVLTSSITIQFISVLCRKVWVRTIQSQWVVANMHHMGPWSRTQTAVSQGMEGNPRYRGFLSGSRNCMSSVTRTVKL
jgi:hypothetical protein